MRISDLGNHLSYILIAVGMPYKKPSEAKGGKINEYFFQSLQLYETLLSGVGKMSTGLCVCASSTSIPQ